MDMHDGFKQGDQWGGAEWLIWYRQNALCDTSWTSVTKRGREELAGWLPFSRGRRREFFDAAKNIDFA